MLYRSGPRPREFACLCRRAGGFTLIELLVVIGIIGILLAVLLPALQRAKASATELKCQTNLRQLMFGALMFANDHRGQLPGNFFDRTRQNQDEQDFLFGAQTSYLQAPQEGTLFRYVNSSYEIFLCPNRRGDAGGQSFGASNGRFDYACYLAWSGAKLAKIKPQSMFTFANGAQTVAPTPMFVEEDAVTINNAATIEGGHGNTDAMYWHHRGGGSFYASPDGSVHFFKPTNELKPSRVNAALDWTTLSPRNATISLGEYENAKWGWFNGQ